MIEVEYNEYKETIEENMKLIQKNHKLQKEIERLNNIINELEKWLEENGKPFIDEYGYIKSIDKMIYIDDIFEELKELKGSDKE